MRKDSQENVDTGDRSSLSPLRDITLWKCEYCEIWIQQDSDPKIRFTRDWNPCPNYKVGTQRDLKNCPWQKYKATIFNE